MTSLPSVPCLYASMGLFLLSLAIVGSASAGSDLGQLSLQAQQAQASVWNGNASLQSGDSGSVHITPDHPVRIGNFAVAHFAAGETGWTDNNLLVLDVRCDEPGELALTLSDTHGDQRAEFSASQALEPGATTLRIRLRGQAKGGDLTPAALNPDADWAPGAASEIQLLLATYPAGFVIDGLRLEQDKPTKETR